jgi:hypothetical protein
MKSETKFAHKTGHGSTLIRTDANGRLLHIKTVVLDKNGHDLTVTMRPQTDGGLSVQSSNGQIIIEPIVGTMIVVRDESQI